jgi:hypothetical protein
MDQAVPAGGDEALIVNLSQSHKMGCSHRSSES